MTNIAAIFFDVDQTLYDGVTGKIPESAISAIEETQKNGIKVFIASGRAYDAVIESGIADQIHWDGYVCSNGAALHDKDGKLLEQFYFSDKQRDQLFSLCKQYNMSLSLQTPDSMLAPFGIDDNMRKSYEFFRTTLPESTGYNQEKICMAVVFQTDDFDYGIINQIEGLMAIKGKVNYADIVQSHIHKGFGILRMKEALHLDGLLMAIGDGDNDLEMIETADIGVAMGNATDNLKKIATYITSAIHEDGVYHALKHYRLF